MSRLLQLTCCLFIFIINASVVQAQTIFKGKIIDAVTGEAIPGASVHCTDEGCNCGCASGITGEFNLHCTNCKQFSVSFIGYATRTIKMEEAGNYILLTPVQGILNTVVVTANKGENTKRSQAPISVSSINTRIIQDTKPTTIDQVLNKVSGVNMVSLGNEQHQMSIRQPMTTKSLFLYLEDGIPVRTTGLFNHNALLEMNMASVKNIEVIKGPSSSLYGSEAIGGVVNFISFAPTAVPVFKVSTQANTIGYKRAELQAGFSRKKWGFALSGYYADKRNSFLEFTDFHKATFTARIDYHLNDKTSLSGSITWLRYFSDMPSGVDSAMFASRKFTNPQTFTYRKVNALRFHETLTHNWNNQSKTTASVVIRDNAIGQNPNYRIREDYKKTGTTWTGQKDLAHGEINESSFKSLAFIAQHKLTFNWKNALFIGGFNTDLSPSQYRSNYIRIKKDTINNKYTNYQQTDSTLSDYHTGINNYAAFGNFEFSPTSRLRVVTSIRYDLFHYTFNNHLNPSAFTGSADTFNNFSRISPKLGLTYSLSGKTGLYANYSQGFVPPQVTEMYTGVKVPRLEPSVFYNYEAGGWAEIVKNRLSADLSVYLLNGTQEIISVKMEDGTSENRNAGKTSHKGIELGIQANPVDGVSLRFSGAWSLHKFESFIEKGINYSGNEMNAAPRWIHNIELWYKPSYLPGFRIGAEWQLEGSYFMDPRNTVKYKGYQVLNLRTGYKWKAMEAWVNVLNLTNNYYSYLSLKTGSGYSYQLAEPLNVNMGISCGLDQLIKIRQ